MSAAIAKKSFAATDFEVAILTTGNGVGLLASFFVAHLAARAPSISLVFWPECARFLAFLGVILIAPGSTRGFVALCMVAAALHTAVIPARVTIYRLNYPVERRGELVGSNRRVQVVVAAVMAILLSTTLEWSAGRQVLVDWFGRPQFDVTRAVQYAFAALGGLGFLGSLIFRRIRVKPSSPRPAHSLRKTLAAFRGVWREDHEFRRYQICFVIFGFANIATMPLVPIHVVDRLGANYFDLALMSVVLTQFAMAISLTFWGRVFDRTTPTRMRGVLNFVFAIELVILAFAPTMGVVHGSRVLRGVAMGGGSLVWMLGSLHYARDSARAPIYVGIHTVLTGVRWIVAPLVGVGMKQQFSGDARPVFLISAGVMAAVGAYMLFTGRAENRVETP